MNVQLWLWLTLQSHIQIISQTNGLNTKLAGELSIFSWEI